MNYFNYKRRQSSIVHIGNTPLGGSYPIRIQSMANVSTMDTTAAVEQAIRLFDVGAEYVRFTAQGEREAQNLRYIRAQLNTKGYNAPLVADIHFNPKAADVAALSVEKVRINPGNYIDKARKFEQIIYTDDEYAQELQKIRNRFMPFIRLCRDRQVAIRIGVNHGSLSDRIMSRYGDTPEGMVESCMEFLRLCREACFDDVVISMKASNTVIMIRAVRLLVRSMDAEGMRYPLHLGVTEAGDGEDGRIKSAVGIGTLLVDGIGDTIRVSLSEEPENEIPVARQLIDCIDFRNVHLPIDAVASHLYDPVNFVKRKSRAVNGIGGDCPPIVISDRTNGNVTVDSDFTPDWIYAAPDNIIHINTCSNFIVDARMWRPHINAAPCFSVNDASDDWTTCSAQIKFIRITCHELTNDMIRLLKNDPHAVVMLDSRHPNGVGEMRVFMHRLLEAECDVPVILCRSYDHADINALSVRAAVDFGALLVDGFGDGIMLNSHSTRDASILDRYMFGILQAARVRISKTEYISCPGCGRTLFDLQKTIARIKAATSDRKDLKIGIMGCIVNGPGEMADADYGYVGAGKGRISLYKGKVCIRKNIPEDEAVERLLELIDSEF